MRPACLAVALLSLSSPLGFSAVTGIDSAWTDNFGGGVTGGFTDGSSGMLLSAGTDVNGDGTIIQFGVFDPAIVPVALDPADYEAVHWGAFIALTGDNSANPQFNTTMGDGVGLNDGFYDIGVTFDTTTGSTGLPGAPARVGIRVFNDLTYESSTAWTTVTHASTDWIMNPPANPFSLSANALLDPLVDPTTGASTLVWEGGVAFVTNVPEPSASLLGLLGAALLLRRRR